MPFTPLDQISQELPRRGFTPIEDDKTSEAQAKPARGFTPLAEEPEKPSLLKTIAMENPATALAETGLNLASQAVALPVAGAAGLYEVAGKALGVHDRDPAGAVEHMAQEMTYQPRGELGKMTSQAVALPFELLAQGGEWLGDRTLDATGSPTLAATVSTAINAAPMAISPMKKGVTAVRERIAGREAGPPTPGAVETVAPGVVPEASPAPAVKPQAAEPPRVIPEPARAYENASAAQTEGVRNAAQVEATPARVDRLAEHEGAVRESQSSGVEVLRGEGGISLPRVGGELRGLSAGRGLQAESGALAGPEGPQPGILPGERGMVAAGRAESIDRSGGGGRGAAEDVAQAAGSGPDYPGINRPIQAGAHVASDASSVVLPDTGPLSRAANLSMKTGAGQVLQAGKGIFPFASEEAAAKHLARRADQEAYQVAPHPTVPGRFAVVPAEISTTRVGVGPLLQEAVAQPEIILPKTNKPWPSRGMAATQASKYPGYEVAQVEGGWALRRMSDESLPVKKTGDNGPAAMDGQGRAAQGFTALEDDVAAGGVRNAWAPGANYAPLIDDTRAAAGASSVADLPAPIRREAIIRGLEKALETTVYEGKVKGQRLGFFRPKLEEVRVKKANDLEVVAHELAHLVDDRIPELGKAWRSDKALRDELLSVSYDKKSAAEGYAESVRLWMTQPDVLEARAPKVAAWLEDFAAKHPYGPALRTAQEQMTGWFGQDALNRARSKIGDHKPLAEYFDGFWDKFRQSTTDDLHGIYQMERNMTGGKLEAVGAYETARLSRASASIADGAIRYGYPVKLPDGSFKYMGRGLEEILKPVAGSLEDALLYFVGRSSHELKMQGRENLFSRGEIDAMLKLKTPERAEAFKAYQEWNKGILDFAEAQGILNPETRKLWKRAEYLPFHRVASPEGGLKGKPGDWQGIQALTGGTENIRDVLGNMTANAAMLIERAVKNEARVKVAEMASRPGGGRFMAKIDPSSRPVRVGGDQVLGEMMKRYGIAIEGDAPAFFEFFVHGQPPGGKNVVAVLKEGKPVWYEVGDPILYRALSALDRPPQHWVVRWLGLPKRIGQASITLDPSFIAANLSRDQVMAGVMTQSGFRPVIDAMAGLHSRLSADPLYRQWVANGGGLSSLFLEEGALRKQMDRFYANQGINPKTVIDAPGKMLYFVERLGEAIESSSRIGEFGRAIQRGEHPRHAAYLSREVSVDWAMKGDSKALSVAYDTVMFLRAASVSMDRIYRGVANDPNRGAIAMKAGMIGLASAMLYLMNRGDPRYDDMEDWKKDAFWHVFVGNEHFKLPKAFEVGAVATIAERTVERTLDKDPGGLGKDVVRIIGNVFGLNWKPQIIAPLFDQATNRQGLNRTPIETPGMEKLQPFLRAKPETSETVKALGMATSNMPESLQVNPSRAEALLRGYLNSWASYGLMASDAMFFSDQKAPMRADEMPVVKKFYEQEPPRSTKFHREFYDMLGEAQRLQGTLRELDKQGRPDIADQKEQSPLATEAKPLERAAKTVKDINAEMLQVRRDKSIPPAEKRQRLDELTAERNAFMKSAVLDARAAQRQ